ncbi:unnamed protein product [Miscanthus lutarioriparius]|uniref:Uncharacterized protein n=1 Tax=Miscanthus lutarioriparius TaxID=422564 RepID=A0A811RHZ6_9POAL|nr:unnamed protein product [Miscanthus lutarioriparius]
MADLHPLDPSSPQRPDLQFRVQPRRGMAAAVPLPVTKVSPSSYSSWVEEGGAAAAAS